MCSAISSVHCSLSAVVFYPPTAPMACGKSRNIVVLMSLGLLLCLHGANSDKRGLRERGISARRADWRRGKLLIGRRPEQVGRPVDASDLDSDYQSDTAWHAPEPKMPQEYNLQARDETALERLLRMNPQVDCSGGHMRLRVEDADSKPGALLFVDRGELSPLSLSKLPKSCGYRVSSTRRDFILVAPFDGCFVLVEESCYVLPLRWFGLPVQMSCPVGLPATPVSNTPMVTCLPGRMIIATDWNSILSEVKVNVRNRWEQLANVAAYCNVAIELPDGISFPYDSPCVQRRDAMYIVNLSGDFDYVVSCPPLALPGSQHLMEDVGHNPTAAPARRVKITHHAPQHDIPRTPSASWNQFPQYGQQPVRTVDKSVGRRFYSPYSDSLPSGMDPSFMFRPDGPSGTAFEREQGHQGQPENPSVDRSSNYGPVWSWPDRKPLFPSDLQPEPLMPRVTPQPPAHLKPVGCPTYPCPNYHPTEAPATNTQSSPVTVPNNYPLFGPYNHQYFPHYPHTTPAPSTPMPQGLSISHPGNVVVYPNHPQSEFQQPMECLRYCQVGVLDCCPQIAFHQHHYHFVPQQNENSHSSLPGLQVGSESLHAPSRGPQEAPAPPSHANAFAPPQLYPYGPRESHAYHQPQEGDVSPLPGNKPREQPDSPPGYYFNANVQSRYAYDMNLQKPQIQHERPSIGSSNYNLFKPAQGTKQYVPYDGHSLHQSDGPPSNMQQSSLLSRIQEYASQSANNADVDVKEPPLVFRNRVPYGMLQEKHISNLQPSDVQSRQQRGFVLLKHGPPGKQRSETGPQVLSDMSQNFANFPNESPSLKEASEDSKRPERSFGNAGQTAQDEVGPVSASASSEQDKVRRIFPPSSLSPRTLRQVSQ